MTQIILFLLLHYSYNHEISLEIGIYYLKIISFIMLIKKAGFDHDPFLFEIYWWIFRNSIGVQKFLNCKLIVFTWHGYILICCFLQTKTSVCELVWYFHLISGTVIANSLLVWMWEWYIWTFVKSRYLARLPYASAWIFQQFKSF